MKVSRLVSLAAVLAALALPVRAQSYCAIASASDQSSLPDFSGTVSGVFASSAGGGQYVYMMTQYGIVRGSLADPAHPGPFVLAQIGHKSTQGIDNGGKVDMICDCWQGGKTIDVAEAPDGSARMISDWNNRGGGLGAEVATADASNKVAFGQQIDSQTVPSGSRIAAIYLPSGKYVGYFPFTSSPNQGGVAMVDITSPSGSPNPSLAMHPFGTLNWGSGNSVMLKTAVSAGKYLLVGAIRAETRIRVAEIDTATGVPTERASIASTATAVSLSVATVEGRTFIFTGEGAIRVYEYANGQLQAVGTIPGAYDEVIVRGGVFPLIFGHNAVGGSTYIDIFDTNWLTRGGAPRQAARIDHSLTGIHPNFLNYLGTRMEAFVSGNNAYVYRARPGSGATAASLIDTTKVDISCISIDPTSPPIAAYSAANLSASTRTDKTNYFGDRWRVQDISATAAAKPLTEIDWDLNVPAPHTTSQFSADPAPWSGAASAALKNLNSPTGIVWPCDPKSNGDPKLGTGCHASLGSPASGAFYLGLHAENANGQNPSSTTVTPGAGVPVKAPAVVVTGLSSGTLNVLSGGTADASSSQGNLAEAKFTWAFRGPTGALPAATCQPVGSNCAKVLVPSAATSFTLDVTYLGGYHPPQVVGTVNVVDLVPDFSPTSGSVVKGGGVVLTNKMQKGSAATLQSVEASWSNEVGSFSVFAGPCPGGSNCGFLSVNGSATLSVPSTTGSYTLYLKYNFTGSRGPQQLKVSHGPFVVVSDNLAVSLIGPTSAARNTTVTFTATIIGASGTPTVSWCWDGCSLFPSFTPGQAIQTHSFSNTGQNTVVVKVADSGVTVTDSVSINITGSGGGGGGGGGGFTASLTGPTTGSVGQAVTFNASASGGTTPITYAWRWGDNALIGYVAGPASNTYAYGGPGTYTVSVKATDAANKTSTKSVSIKIAGDTSKPPPSGQFDVAGATVNPFNGQLAAEAFQPITFTAAEANASYAWDFGDGTTASARSVVKSFASTGAFTVTLTVSGDVTHTSGTATSNKKFAIGAAQFSAIVVPDAAAVVTTDGAWKTDVTVTNAGPSTLTIAPIYRSYESLVPVAPATGIDVTALGFDTVTKYEIAPGGSWSQADVIGFLGGTGKGNLFFKTEGGPPPEVAARVYFEPTDTEQGTYGNAIAAFQVGAFGQVGVLQARAVSEQTILGLRSDEQFRFKVKLYNSSGQSSIFRLQAFDEGGNALTLRDGTGASVASLDFPVGAYQSAELGDDGLGLNDPTHRYVLKAEPISNGAMLVASASVIDRTTNDQVQVADDATRPVEEDGAVRVYVPAVSRLDTAISHWRTSVSILNSAGVQRSVLVEYVYGPSLTAQKIFTMEAGKLLAFDDISEIYADVPEIASGSATAGLLKVSYAGDAETSTRPLLVSARSFDDRSTTTGGTAGTALSSYSTFDAVAVGDGAIVIPGAETNDRFRTNVGIFALDDEVTTVLITAVDRDGNVVGSAGGALNNPGASGPWLQFPIALISGMPAEPVSLRVEVTGGGRIGAYAINIDQKSADTTFIKGTR